MFELSIILLELLRVPLLETKALREVPDVFLRGLLALVLILCEQEPDGVKEQAVGNGLLLAEEFVLTRQCGVGLPEVQKLIGLGMIDELPKGFGHLVPHCGGLLAGSHISPTWSTRSSLAISTSRC